MRDVLCVGLFFLSRFVCEVGFCETFCLRVGLLRGVLFVGWVCVRHVVCGSVVCEARVLGVGFVRDVLFVCLVFACRFFTS